MSLLLTSASVVRPLRRAQRGAAALAILAMASCSSVEVESLSAAQGAGAAGTTTAGAESSGAEDSTAPEDPHTGGPAGSGGSDTGGGDRDADGVEGLEPSGASCPEPWPGAWLFCEDFDALESPLDSFSEYASGDGAFVVDRGLGAMRADYRQGEEGAGWLLVSFGDSPVVHGGVTYAPQQRFDELYWRVHVLHEPGWPDVGPGWLARATAFANADWAEAVVGHIRSNGTDPTLEAAPVTCVAGESVMCEVYNDQSALESLDAFAGTTPVSSKALSGEWVCVEAHIKLNAVGKADGVFEFWVDGQLENGGTMVDWRGSWNTYGLNAVTLQNFWPGGATADLSRWMDDLVISTERIGCDL